MPRQANSFVVRKSLHSDDKDYCTLREGDEIRLQFDGRRITLSVIQNSCTMECYRPASLSEILELLPVFFLSEATSEEIAGQVKRAQLRFLSAMAVETEQRADDTSHPLKRLLLRIQSRILRLSVQKAARDCAEQSPQNDLCLDKRSATFDSSMALISAWKQGKLSDGELFEALRGLEDTP